MDSDLADAVESLRAAFESRRLPLTLEKAPKELVEALKKDLRLPLRYRNFLLGANPVAAEIVTPVERIRLIPADELMKVQDITKGGPAGTTLDWKPSWVVIGESSLLGDPYFLDTSKPDLEGDCPVYTAESKQPRWMPKLAASTFAQFLRIAATSMEVAAGFGDAIMDDEDEDNFREALGPKIKVIDAAALRAGHWT